MHTVGGKPFCVVVTSAPVRCVWESALWRVATDTDTHQHMGSERIFVSSVTVEGGLAVCMYVIKFGGFFLGGAWGVKKKSKSAKLCCPIMQWRVE